MMKTGDFGSSSPELSESEHRGHCRLKIAEARKDFVQSLSDRIANSIAYKRLISDAEHCKYLLESPKLKEALGKNKPEGDRRRSWTHSLQLSIDIRKGNYSTVRSYLGQPSNTISPDSPQEDQLAPLEGDELEEAERQIGSGWAELCADHGIPQCLANAKGFRQLVFGSLDTNAITRAMFVRMLSLLYDLRQDSRLGLRDAEMLLVSHDELVMGAEVRSSWETAAARISDIATSLTPIINNLDIQLRVTPYEFKCELLEVDESTADASMSSKKPKKPKHAWVRREFTGMPNTLPIIVTPSTRVCKSTLTTHYYLCIHVYPFLK